MYCIINMSEMNPAAMELQTFLKRHRVFDTQDYSHASIKGGKYRIPQTLYKTFFEIYKRAIDTGYIPNIVEKPNDDHKPLMFDIDVYKPQNHDGPVWKYDDVKKFIKHIERVCEHVVGEDVELMDPQRACVLLTKDETEKIVNGKLMRKNGFHLHFPKMFYRRSTIEAYIYPKVKDMCESLFGQGSLDGAGYKNAWTMYGSAKPNSQPYKVDRCYAGDEWRTHQIFRGYECYAVPGEDTPPSLDTEEDVANNWHRILSTWLHVRSKNYFLKPKDSVVTPAYDVARMYQMTRPENSNDKRDEETMHDARAYLELISPDRADDYNDWVAVGFALFNVSNGTQQGLDAWCEFSENSSKYSEAVCIQKWKSMHIGKTTMGTLKYFAKIDDKEGYYALIGKKRDFLVKCALSGTNYDIAQLLHQEYSDEFVFGKSGQWYQFRHGYWKKLHEGHTLRGLISHEHGGVIQALYKARQEVYDLIADAEEDDNTKHLEKQIQHINKILRSCKTTSFINSVMTESKFAFLDMDFEDQLDTDTTLVPFLNGVFDTTDMTFRPGEPEDRLSVTLDIYYNDNLYMFSTQVEAVTNFFMKIFPDENLRDYVLDNFAKSFLGGNKEKICTFWVGNGDNGKTITQNLMEKMYGKLAVKFDTSLLTGKKTNLGQACPELARSRGARWAVMDEPNKDEKINSGRFKNLTGNDSIWVRDLFQKGTDVKEMTPAYKLAMICNSLPEFEGDDEATWNRARVFPFESKFLNPGDPRIPKTFQEQLDQKIFPKDEDMSSKLKSMTEACAWMLLDRLKRMNGTPTKIPEKVTAATSDYRDSVGGYGMFLRQCTQKGPEKTISVKAITDLYCTWYQDDYTGKKCSRNRQAIIQEFVRRLGQIQNGKFIGIGIVSDD